MSEQDAPGPSGDPPLQPMRVNILSRLGIALMKTAFLIEGNHTRHRRVLRGLLIYGAVIALVRTLLIVGSRHGTASAISTTAAASVMLTLAVSILAQQLLTQRKLSLPVSALSSTSILLSLFSLAILVETWSGLSALWWETSFATAERIYLWHLADSVPLLNLPEAFGWAPPQPPEPGGNPLLLLMKIAAIGPLIQLVLATYQALESERAAFHLKRREDFRRGFWRYQPDLGEYRTGHVANACLRSLLLTLAVIVLIRQPSDVVTWIQQHLAFGWLPTSAPQLGRIVTAVVFLISSAALSIRLEDSPGWNWPSAAFGGAYLYSGALVVTAGWSGILVIWLCLTSLAMILIRQTWVASKVTHLIWASLVWIAAINIVVCLSVAVQLLSTGGQPEAVYGRVWWKLVDVLPGPEITATLGWAEPTVPASRAASVTMMVTILVALVMLAFPLARALRSFQLPQYPDPAPDPSKPCWTFTPRAATPSSPWRCGADATQPIRRPTTNPTCSTYCWTARSASPSTPSARLGRKGRRWSSPSVAPPAFIDGPSCLTTSSTSRPSRTTSYQRKWPRCRRAPNSPPT